MEADFPACRGVIAEFIKALESQNLGYLSPALYRHLSACSRCHDGMLLLMSGLEPRLCRYGAGYSCEQCQADLAAFIELELDNPAQAAATYPHVWRHLWICWACARTYEYTHTLLAAERSGWLVSPQLVTAAAQRSAPIIRRVRLTRQILALAIPRRVGTVTRGSDDDYVLFDALEEQPERRHLTIAVQAQANSVWRMVVTAIPPPRGVLVLSSGALQLAAPFDSRGQVSIGDIPADVLLDPDAPDIMVDIVHAEESGTHFL
jgi:hypothetical protein